MPYAIFETAAERHVADGMEGSVAIVTGGGTGIGAGVVRALAARGVRCVVNYAHSRDEAEALAEDVGGVAVRADIADDDACRALAAAAVERFGRLDYLVNNAGRTKFADHEDLDALDAEDFVDIYRFNTVAAFQMVRACAPAMREGPASAVVNVASVAGIRGHGSSVAYAASKGALITMTQSLGAVLVPAIRINAVAPGYVGTGWFEKRLGKAGFAAPERAYRDEDADGAGGDRRRHRRADRHAARSGEPVTGGSAAHRRRRASRRRAGETAGAGGLIASTDQAVFVFTSSA